MLDKLKGLLESKPPAKSSGTRSWNPNFVTDPVRIASLLNDMVHQRLALGLQLADESGDPDDLITTFMYKVGTERAAIKVPDEPEADAKIRAAGGFKLITTVMDRTLTFKAEILTIQEEDGQDYYVIRLPDRVYYPPYEKPQRVKFDKHRVIPVYLRFFEPQKTYPGVIDELGPRGIIVLLSGSEQTLPYIRKGDELKSCSFGVGTRQIKFDARVGQVRRINDKQVRIDCVFKSPSTELKDAIQALMKGG